MKQHEGKSDKKRFLTEDPVEQEEESKFAFVCFVKCI